MQLKSKESVHFIDSISPDGEFALVNSYLTHSPFEITSTISKTYGNYLNLSNDKAFKSIDLEFVDLKYSQENELVFYLTLMLLSAPPFYNFVVNAVENSKDSPPLVKSFYKIVLALKEKKGALVEDYLPFRGADCVVEGYRFILQSIHRQLLSYFYFSKDSWTTPNKKKPIYDAFSPISSIFHGEGENGYFDVLEGEVPASLPSVTLLKTKEIPKDLPEGVVVSSVLAREDNAVLYVKSLDKWVKYTRGGVVKVNSLDGIVIEYAIICKSL